MNRRAKRPWREVLLQDWHRYSRSSPSWKAVLRALIYNGGFLAVFLMRLAKELRERRWTLLAGLARRFNTIVSAAELRPKAEVEPGLFLPHPYGVTIGNGSRIGKNVTLFQGVTIGARTIGDLHEGGQSEYPQIGEGVVIYPNALVYGGIRVGEKAVILGNSVVSSDVAPNATVGGIPAREIKPQADVTG